MGVRRRMAVNEVATKVGIVDVAFFDGPGPTTKDEWERLIAYTHGLADAPPDLVAHETFRNRLSDHALSSMAKLMVGEYVKLPAKIKLGTGSPPAGQTTPLTTDSDCWTPDNTTVKSLDLITTFLSVYAEFGVTYATTEANGVTYTEALLYDEDGTSWAHVIINFSKTSATPKTGVVLWKILSSQSS